MSSNSWIYPQDYTYGENSNGYRASNVGAVVGSLVVFVSVPLFCMLIWAVACCCRRGRRAARTAAAPPPHEPARAQPPLSASAVGALPTFAYDRTADRGGWAQCAICLSVIRRGEMVKQMPVCKHLYHVKCIDEWLSAHSTCPLCRSDIGGTPPRPPV